MGNTGSMAANLTEGLVSCQSRGSIMTMGPGSSPGSMLSNPAGVIKPGRTVLVVLVGVVWARGSGESHLLTGCKEQGINSSCLSLRVTKAGGLL